MKLIACLITLLLIPTVACASLLGSTVEMELPASSQIIAADQVETVQFRFKVTNRSHDGNWIANVHFTFPDRCWINAMTWDDSASSETWLFDVEGLNTHTAHFHQSDAHYIGEIPGWHGPGEDDCDYGWFIIDVIIAPGPVALDAIAWLLEGDDYGLPPHDLEGTLPLNFYSTPTAASTFSNVKALY